MESADDFRKLHNHPQWAEVERNAKRFAAAILIPHQALTIEAREGYAEIVEQLRQRGRDTMITQGPVEKWLCTRLARRFEVSEFAMRNRMREWPAKIAEKIASAIEDGRPYL
jgi:Zn-dependent peptidase ImmA (M78 family)